MRVCKLTKRAAANLVEYVTSYNGRILYNVLCYPEALFIQNKDNKLKRLFVMFCQWNVKILAFKNDSCVSM